jgi:hypothetical protein
MKHLRPCHSALATLVAVVLLGGSASATLPPTQSVTFATTPIAVSTTTDAMDARIDGHLMVWVHESLSADSAIGVYNLATGQTRLIGSGDGRVQDAPDVSGDSVVYQEDSGTSEDIRIYRWSSNASNIVVNTGNSEVSPRIDGSIVIWKDNNTGYLWYLDYDSLNVPAPIRVTAAGTEADDWDVDCGRILWSTSVNNDLMVSIVRPHGPSLQLTAFFSQPEFTEWHGDHAVFASPFGEVYGYNFRQRLQMLLASGASMPTVFDTTRAWVTSGNITYTRPGFLNATLGDAEADNRPSLFGPRIVWDRTNGTGDWDVMLATATPKLSTRTFGTNRYATAAAVSRQYFEGGDFVYAPYLDNVVLCTGENFPDALAAAPLARALGAPLLLTKRDSIPPETLTEITRLAPTKVYIIGGTPAVSTAVENQLKTASYQTERIAGADRYETSAKIAAKLNVVTGSDAMYRAFFARGDIFPDALALGPVAAGAASPILLVKPTSVPASVASAVDTLDIKRGYVAGDTTAVSSGVSSALGALISANNGNPNLSRLAGDSRYDTAVAIIQSGLDHGWIDLDTLGVATGMNFPDALGGGSAMGYYGSPVILTGPTSVPASVNTFLTAHEYDVGRVDVFGGPDVVSDAVKNAIVAKLK